MTLEKRTLTAPVEVRKASDKRTVAGYAALFNSEADIGGAFREVIAPGAFAGTLGSDIRALVDHDSGRVIGRSTAGTLRLSEDDKGLAVEIDLPDTTDGRDLAVSLERGDISGMSFGFRVTKDTWDQTGAMPLRTIQAVDLFEVSAVAFPAYADTEIALRSLEATRTQTEKDRAERNAKMAKARISARKAASEQRFRGIAVARMMDDGLSPLEEAMKWLDKAIKRHERHMDGTESTSKASQQKMMDEMMAAMDALKRFTES